MGNIQMRPVAYFVGGDLLCYSDCSNVRQRVRFVGESLKGVIVVPPGGLRLVPPEAQVAVWELPYAPKNFYQYLKLIRSYRGRISAVHHPFSNEMTLLKGLLLSLFSGVPVVLGCWDPPANVLWNEPTPFRLFRRVVMIFMMNLSIGLSKGALITHHPGFWRSKCLPFVFRKIRFFPNGTTYWKNQEVMRRVPKVPKRFAMACRVSELKGCWTVADFFIRLYKADPEVSLVWVGGGLDREVRQHMIGAGVPADRLIMPGALERDETLPYIATATYALNLYPNVESLRWNYLIKLPEFLSLGQPTITNDLPGSLEYVREGETGIVVSLNDLDASVKRTVDLINDAELTSRMRENALKVAPTYDWHKINDDMAACLRQILAGENPKGTIA